MEGINKPVVMAAVTLSNNKVIKARATEVSSPTTLHYYYPLSLVQGYRFSPPTPLSSQIKTRLLQWSTASSSFPPSPFCLPSESKNSFYHAFDVPKSFSIPKGVSGFFFPMFRNVTDLIFHFGLYRHHHHPRFRRLSCAFL